MALLMVDTWFARVGEYSEMYHLVILQASPPCADITKFRLKITRKAQKLARERQWLGLLGGGRGQDRPFLFNLVYGFGFPPFLPDFPLPGFSPSGFVLLSLPLCYYL